MKFFEVLLYRILCLCCILPLHKKLIKKSCFFWSCSICKCSSTAIKICGVICGNMAFHYALMQPCCRPLSGFVPIILILLTATDLESHVYAAFSFLCKPLLFFEGKPKCETVSLSLHHRWSLICKAGAQKEMRSSNCFISSSCHAI